MGVAQNLLKMFTSLNNQEGCQTQAVGKSQAWEQGLVSFALAEAQQ